MPRVLLHVGLPKTGTSFLQSVLSENAAVLADLGVHRPDAPGQSLFQAVLYLTDRSASWGRSAEAGRRAWDRVLADVRRREGTVVVSSETLCLARPEHVARIVEDLGADDVEVVLTARDLGRQLPAEWQEGVKHGRRGSFDDFLDTVLGERGDDARPAGGNRHDRFWNGQDPVAVLDRWAAHLPPHHVHLVVGPPAGAAPEVLWQRFASVLDVAPDRLDTLTLPARQVNASLGAAQLEVLRRVNQRFVRKGREQSYGTVAKRLYAGTLLREQKGDKVTLPADRLARADQVADRWIAQLADRDWNVIGELDELRPVESGPCALDVVTTRDLLASALDATAGLLEEVERLGRENSRLRRADGADGADGSDGSDGSGEGGGLGSRVGAVVRRAVPGTRSGSDG